MTSGFWQENPLPTVKTNGSSRIDRNRRRCCQKFLLAAICIFCQIFNGSEKNTPNRHRICAKPIRVSSDLSKTHQISTESNPYLSKTHYIVTGSERKQRDLAKISPDLSNLARKCYVSRLVRVSSGFGVKIRDRTDQIGFWRKRPTADRWSSRVSWRSTRV